MSDLLRPMLTGRTRHRVDTTRNWFGRSTQRLVMQHEVRGFVPEYSGGRVDGSTRQWWVDSKPEWLMQEDEA